jgi:NAD(P)-dependent dehydrogenase (short-subunit alcohol dehydrogenase family)
MSTLRGKVMVVTGAARGIGAETARRAAREGAQLALVGLEPEELAAVARACGPDTMVIEADISDEASITGAYAQIAERFGRIDVVFQNAGIATGGTLREIDPDAFTRVIEVNVLGTFRACRAALPHLERSRGYLLVNASIAALVTGFPGMGAYSTSKAGTEAIANTLRMEMRHHGVDVGCVYYSWIDTDMVRGGDEHRAFRTLRATLKWPMSKTSPLSLAAERTVAGIGKRSRLIVVPWWVRAMLPLRGLLQPLAEPTLWPSIPTIEREFQEEIAERGAENVFRPVGAGGKAAERPVSP